MANHAVHKQLPIMVRHPKVVWPGLVKMSLYQQEIAGDGNCLFASLSDQLFGTYSHHSRIRASIINYMRQNRHLFEHYVLTDDVEQRRALRKSTVNARKPETEDAFEEYLSLMSRLGTYGGEPELVAFCQVYQRDVTVHLPSISKEERESIVYKNENREPSIPVQPPLHICYGGDEITRPHYDSARSTINSVPRKPYAYPPERRRSHNGLITPSPSPNPNLPEHLNRAKRYSRSGVTAEEIQEMVAAGRRELDGSFDLLGSKERARSSSISSSHRSSSSKRSLGDDCEQPRTTKRADRRKSIKSRTKMSGRSNDKDPNTPFRLRIDSPGPDTPTSTQDTEYSSDQADNNETSSNGDDDYHDASKAEQSSDTDDSLDRAMAAMKAQPSQRKRPGIAHLASRETTLRAGLSAGSE